jgi:predicted dehydrogenase
LARRSVRVAVIGCGGVAQYGHLPAIDAIPDIELVSVCDVNRSIARSCALAYGVRDFDLDYKTTLSRDIDAVIISVPNYLHCKITIEAAQRGKHILCEKPIAVSLEEAESMITACERNHVVLQIGYHQRFFPESKIVKKLIEKRQLGKVLSARSSLREGWRLYKKFSTSNYRFDAAQARAGVIFDLTTHRIDLLRWFLGDVKRVVGVANRLATPKELTTLDDHVSLICEFVSGAYGIIDSDSYSPVTTNLTELYGTEGTCFFTSENFNPFQPVPIALHTRAYSDRILSTIYPKARSREGKNIMIGLAEAGKKAWTYFWPPRENPYVGELRDFVDCILKGKQPLVDGRQGAKNLEVALAVFESMRTSSWVRLPLSDKKKQ